MKNCPLNAQVKEGKTSKRKSFRKKKKVLFFPMWQEIFQIFLFPEIMHLVVVLLEISKNPREKKETSIMSCFVPLPLLPSPARPIIDTKSLWWLVPKNVLRHQLSQILRRKSDNLLTGLSVWHILCQISAQHLKKMFWALFFACQICNASSGCKMLFSFLFFSFRCVFFPRLGRFSWWHHFWVYGTKF